MNKIKEFLFYSGISKERFYQIRDIRREDNRKNVVAFSILFSIAFLVAAGLQFESKMGIGPFVMGILAVVFGAFALIAATVAKKYIVLGSTLMYFYMTSILLVGVYSGVSQPLDRTTLLLPFFLLPGMLFCPQYHFCMIISILAETLYLILISQKSSGDILTVNVTNTLIFCIGGIIGTAYILKLRYKKYEADYLNKYLIERDALTAVYNRHSFEQEINKIKSEKISVAFCSCDINQLKSINDTCGHYAGDKLIKGAAECISKVVGEKGKVFRVGGDEFIAVLYSGYDNAEEIKDSIKAAGAEWSKGNNEQLELSCGITVLEENFDTKLDETLKRADELMYEDKRRYYESRKIDRRRAR